MATNLTDRLGELVDKVTPGPCSYDGGTGYGDILGHRVRADSGPTYVVAVALADVPELAEEAEANAEYTALCFTHKDEILSALRKAEQPVSGDYAELVGRLRAAAFWPSTVEDLPVRLKEAATAIEQLIADRDLWKQSEEICSRQHDLRAAEVERLTAREAELQSMVRDALENFESEGAISARWVAAARLSLGDEK